MILSIQMYHLPLNNIISGNYFIHYSFTLKKSLLFFFINVSSLLFMNTPLVRLMCLQSDTANNPTKQ